MVQANTIGDCLIELGKSINVLEIYRQQKNIKNLNNVTQEEYKIIVNAREEFIISSTINYSQLVYLAFGNIEFINPPSVSYTFLYEKSNSIDLFEGDHVDLQDDMIFHVTMSTPGISYKK